MSKPTTWIIIALITAIIIVVIIKAVQKSAATRAAANAAENQTTLALAALAYKQQQDAIYAGEHAGVGDWLNAGTGLFSAIGSIFSGVQIGGSGTGGSTANTANALANMQG